MSCERPWMHHRWVCNHAGPSQHQRPVSANKHESVRTLCLEISLVLLLTSSDASGCSLLDCVNYPTCAPPASDQCVNSCNNCHCFLWAVPSRAEPRGVTVNQRRFTYNRNRKLNQSEERVQSLSGNIFIFSAEHTRGAEMCGSYRYWFVLLQNVGLVYDLHWRRFLCKHKKERIRFGAIKVACGEFA